MADLRPAGRGQAADHRGQRGRAGAPLGFGQRLVPRDDRAERIRAAVGLDELRRGADDLQRAGLTLLAGRAPGGDAVAAEDAADGLRVGRGDRGDVQAELEAGPPPRHPRHPAAEARGGQLLPVRRCRQGDAGVGVQMVDVRLAEQPVHRGVDRRRGATPGWPGPHHPAQAVQAEVERGDHLILPVHARVDAGQRAQPVQPQHRQAVSGQRPQVPTRPLDPQQLHVLAGNRINRGALGGGVAAGVVRVPRVGAEPVRSGNEFLDAHTLSLVFSSHAPQPACWPSTLSATIFSA